MTPLSEPVTHREEFLAAAVAVIMLCGVLSFLLMGRVSERTHVALAMLGVLTGGFSLLILFGGLLYGSPIAAVFVMLILVGLFKLMGQFEGARKPGRQKSDK
jgi:CHASE2 domain-containing sensor protein